MWLNFKLCVCVCRQMFLTHKSTFCSVNFQVIFNGERFYLWKITFAHTYNAFERFVARSLDKKKFIRWLLRFSSLSLSPLDSCVVYVCAAVLILPCFFWDWDLWFVRFKLKRCNRNMCVVWNVSNHHVVDECVSKSILNGMAAHCGSAPISHAHTMQRIV